MKPTVTRRFFAGFINFIILGMMESTIAYLFHYKDFSEQLSLFIASLVFWIVCLYMKSSPGQNILSLVVVDSDEHLISRKTTFFRLLPYSVYILSLALAVTSEMIGFFPIIFGSLNFFTMLFLFTNLLAVPFHTDRQSLMDMRFRTYVLRFPPENQLNKI